MSERILLPPRARELILTGLSAAPMVIERLLRGATAAELDCRPDPERFTIREVVAHLADQSVVTLERFEQMLAEEHPTLLNWDESQAAVENDYAHADVAEQQVRFRDVRRRQIDLLAGLSPEAWQRTGFHTLWGTLTVEGLAIIALGHDGYHLRQISEWLDVAGKLA